MTPAVLFVLRGPSGYLGRAGKHLHLTGEADLQHASPYLTLAESESEADRARQILGQAFAAEGHAVADLILDSRKS